MRRSRKETMLLEPNNRLMHNDIHESAGMENGSFTTEVAQEWTAGHVSIKHSPRKPPKP